MSTPHTGIIPFTDNTLDRYHAHPLLTTADIRRTHCHVKDLLPKLTINPIDPILILYE